MTAPLKPGELMFQCEVDELCPQSRSTRYRDEKIGKFPKRIKISTKRVAWRRSEIEAWLAERMALSRSDEPSA